MSVKDRGGEMKGESLGACECRVPEFEKLKVVGERDHCDLTSEILRKEGIEMQWTYTERKEGCRN